jgi:PTH2 family peptidyl-tRNA hydrolase
MAGVKQVIVLRKDLRNKSGQKLRFGKLAVQVAHAAMKVFFDRIDRFSYEDDINKNRLIMKNISLEMRSWIDEIFTKICVSVNSEEELFEIYNQAKDAGLPCTLIQDAGKTEFKEPTYTCCAIGPANEEKINKITGELSLL